ncbi:phosphopantetheine-binding protein [Methylobacter sp. Wu8]|uniref:acyl carrier protein n=1 Tax=Methylobacter sp. Wu8 TaxID=3118457 RepID=UPI002F329033
MTTNSTTLDTIQHLFAEVTRYPRELLTPNADLEEDLGIDSVKLGEILAVLREYFGLESRLTDDIREIRTIATIAALLDDRLGRPQAPPAAASQLPAVNNQQDLLAQVTSVVAEVTRYPIELLAPNAELEEDLGIDSVKLGEILAVLREHFGLESRLTDDIREIRTITTIAALLEDRLDRPQAMPAAAPAIIVSQLPAANNQQDLLAQVTNVVAEVTRYPIELLAPNADLEEDLGIDSVKLGEILAVLREHFGLESRLTDDIREIRTIATIAALLSARCEQSQAVVQAA